MQQIDLSSTSCPTAPQPTPEHHPALPEERDWRMGLAPFVTLLLGPVTLGLAYLSWKSYDSPFKGEFWNGGVDFGVFLWLALLCFLTLAAIAFGDFQRLFRHLSRRKRS